MGVHERKERHKEGLRQEILEAARDLFVNDGYRNVSMRRIAEKIEYSPTTIYLYFKDKSDLLQQLCEETFAALYRALEAITLQFAGQDPLIQLREGLRCYVQFGLHHPNQYKVTFINGYQPEDFKKDYLDPGTYGMRTFGHLQKCVAECVRQDKLRNTDVEAVSQALWACIHGITSLLIVHHHFPWTDKEKLVDLVIDSAIAGLKKNR